MAGQMVDSFYPQPTKNYRIKRASVRLGHMQSMEEGGIHHLSTQITAVVSVELKKQNPDFRIRKKRK